MTPVRPAVPADRAAVLDLCRLLHEENGQHAVDWPSVALFIDKCLNRENAILGVIGPVGAPVAAIAIWIDGVWYSKDFQLNEVFAFVHPDHRRTDYAKSLITYGKGCADATGLDLVIGIFSDVRLEPKVRLYARQVREAGRFFCYRPARDGAEVAAAAE